MTNRNYRVSSGGESFAVRLGRDLPAHGVLRSNELAAARAAFACGISPEVVFAARGVMVSRMVAGRTLGADDLRDARRLPMLVDILRRCHRDLPGHLRGASPMFWVFHVIGGYCAALRQRPDSLLREQLPRLQEMARQLEAAVGPVEIVFGHNDLLAANFLDDGQRLWLIDWDYAGFNSPLFDLANLSANNGFSDDLDRRLLELYFGARPHTELLRVFKAMQCASVLREVLWGAVSRHSSTIRFDYTAYTLNWLAQLDRFWGNFKTAEATF